MSEIVYTPSESDLNHSFVAQFMQRVNQQESLKLSNYEQLHQWSVDNKVSFWNLVVEFCGINFSKQGQTELTNPGDFFKSTWYEGYQLNYAEHLVSNLVSGTCLYFKAEDKINRSMSSEQLKAQVSSMQQYLVSIGVKQGDRVSAFIPNMPETIICMLATSSIGAVWSSCSPDFGAQGVIDRFGQIEPKVFITTNFYYYNGKKHDCTEKTQQIMSGILSIKNHCLIEFDLVETENKFNNTAVESVSYQQIIKQFESKTCFFEALDFNHPLFIMYSSGTTGVPKCIVHGAGGTLLQHKKEHQLHGDFKPNETVFYFTTCGWMMWNWLVTALASHCRLALYDGSPFYPKPSLLFAWVDDIGINHFGTSAKYIDALNNEKIDIKQLFKLNSLRSILSTGSPLSDESYDYTYQKIKSDVRLVSISGGTDIVSCFALGTPLKPIIKGQLQAKGLGMEVSILNDDGKTIMEQKGELSCLSSFPSKPIYFWNDENNKKYHAAYFEKINNTWCHGDYAEETKDNGIIIYGRSDATLNPCGVRIGTAEIYRQVECLDEIKESIVIGQPWDNDVRIVLFIVLNDGYKFNDELVKKIKTYIRKQTTPRHVPAVIAPVSEIPKTKSGKIVELAVTQVVRGEPVNNLHALANPEALDEYKNRKELL